MVCGEERVFPICGRARIHHDQADRHSKGKKAVFFCLSHFSLAFYLPHNSSVFVYPTSPQHFFCCQYQLSSSLCLSLSRRPFVYLTYPQPFVFLCLVPLLSISPTLSSSLSNLTVGRLLSFYPHLSTLYFSSSRSFPFSFSLSLLVLSISRLISLLYNSHLLSLYLSLLFLAFVYLTFPRSLVSISPHLKHDINNTCHRQYFLSLFRLFSKPNIRSVRSPASPIASSFCHFHFIIPAHSLETSVADPNPDPPDPHVFGPGSGSGSISQRYGSGSGSGSGSFYRQAK